MARKIPLRKVEFTQLDADPDDKADVLDYRVLMIQIAKAPADFRGGSDIDEIRKSMLVLDALDEADGKGSVILEDAWWRTLRDKAKSFRFRFAHRVIVDFMDAIEQAETVKAAEAKAPESAE